MGIEELKKRMKKDPLDKKKMKFKEIEEETEEETHGTSVYFIQSEIGGPIKIGYSNDPNRRLNEIQNMSPFRLQILGTIPGNMELEASFHQKFASDRLWGEWFEPSVPLLKIITALGGGR